MKYLKLYEKFDMSDITKPKRNNWASEIDKEGNIKRNHDYKNLVEATEDDDEDFDDDEYDNSLFKDYEYDNQKIVTYFEELLGANFVTDKKFTVPIEKNLKNLKQSLSNLTDILEELDGVDLLPMGGFPDPNDILGMMKTEIDKK